MLSRLPEEISQALCTQNGFIAAGGGFHVRGACLNPVWHSIRAAWECDLALHHLFPKVLESDIPLAEDCFGDQYLLRGSTVIRLFGETGEIEDMKKTWADFLNCVEVDPVEFLQLQHLVRFEREGGLLPPGSLLSVYPPFVSEEGATPSLRPVPAFERRCFLADFAQEIKDVPDGQRLQIRVI